MPDIPGRILLVNSNPLMLSLERGYFSRQRINVASAQSASEALKMLPALRPQVVILAHELVDMSGSECVITSYSIHYTKLYDDIDTDMLEKATVFCGLKSMDEVFGDALVGDRRASLLAEFGDQFTVAGVYPQRGLVLSFS